VYKVADVPGVQWSNEQFVLGNTFINCSDQLCDNNTRSACQ